MRQTRTELQTVKLEGHTSSEQVHTNFLLHTPHDRTNQLAGGLHREGGGLELHFRDVLRGELDDIVEVPADLVDHSGHGDLDVAKLLQISLYWNRRYC